MDDKTGSSVIFHEFVGAPFNWCCVRCGHQYHGKGIMEGARWIGRRIDEHGYMVRDCEYLNFDKNEQYCGPKKHLTLAVDYDGTIVERGFPKHNPPREGAKEVMQYWYDQGHYLIIYSARTCLHFSGEEGVKRHTAEMTAHLQACGIPFHEVYNRHGKPVADLYVDDRAVHPDSWWVTLREVEQLGQHSLSVEWPPKLFQEELRIAREMVEQHPKAIKRRLEEAEAMLRVARAEIAVCRELLFRDEQRRKAVQASSAGFPELAAGSV